MIATDLDTEFIRETRRRRARLLALDHASRRIGEWLLCAIVAWLILCGLAANTVGLALFITGIWAW